MNGHEVSFVTSKYNYPIDSFSSSSKFKSLVIAELTLI